MEILKSVLNIFNSNFIICFIPTTIFVYLISLVIKNKAKTQLALKIISWIIIVYAIISFIYFLLGMCFYKNEFAFTNRAVGLYWWSYWTMFLGSTVLPFSLFYKKLSTKTFYLIFVLFFINCGLYFERFVIIVTSLHRDYEVYEESNFICLAISIWFLQGFIIALIFFSFIEIYFRYKPNQQISKSTN